MAVAAIILLQICLFLLGTTWASHIDIIPHQTSANTGGILSFTCHAGEPIESCMIYNPYNKRWLSVPEKGYVDRLHELVVGVKHVYNGKGYENGNCGVLITNVNFKHDGEWKCRVEIQRDGTLLEDTIQLHVSDDTRDEGLTMTALQSASKIGDSHASFICHSNKPISKCEFKPPNKNYWIAFKNSSFDVSLLNSETHNRHLYYGKGLQNGDCGIFLRNVRLQDSGNWMCRVKGLNDSFSNTQIIPLNVVGTARDHSSEASVIYPENVEIGVSQNEHEDYNTDISSSTLISGIVGATTVFMSILVVVIIVSIFCRKSKDENILDDKSTETSEAIKHVRLLEDC